MCVQASSLRPSIKKTRMSVADATVAWVEIYGLIAPKVFIVQGRAKQERFYGAELFC
jgi:hypothetical protein